MKNNCSSGHPRQMLSVHKDHPSSFSSACIWCELPSWPWLLIPKKKKSSAAPSISRMRLGWAGAWLPAWRQVRQCAGPSPEPPSFPQPPQKGTLVSNSGCRSTKRRRRGCRTASARCPAAAEAPRSRAAGGKLCCRCHCSGSGLGSMRSRAGFRSPEWRRSALPPMAHQSCWSWIRRWWPQSLCWSMLLYHHKTARCGRGDQRGTCCWQN